jgi:glycine/D-amino acid oxidase-like deaminating enzyme
MIASRERNAPRIVLVAMDLKSTHPFWLIKNGLIRSYPALKEDVRCDVTVIGSGIGGALVADRLAAMGQHVVVLDRREVVMGSTSASTSLLQYEIDVMLIDLAARIGPSSARRAYQLCYQSIDRLAELVETLPVDCGFDRKLSLYIASNEKDAEKLRREHTARRACDIDVDYIAAAPLRETYGLNYPAALVSRQAASVDAYRLAHALLERTCDAGGEVYDRTDVTRFEQLPGRVRLHTDRGPIVEAKHVVIATGYETQHMLREKIVDLKSTYAVVTQPLPDLEPYLEPWDQDWIMWETKRPYFYLRATSDNRLLAGGEDDNFRDPARRDRNLLAKSQALQARLRDFFPELELEIEYRWAGTFGETVDGLPYIGVSPEYPNCLFALGFGGNGITFSSIAADLIAQCLSGTTPDDLDIFRFGR